MSGKLRNIGIAAALALAALGATSQAEAATVSVADGKLSYTAASGETNKVTIANMGGSYDVLDTYAPVEAGPGCSQVTSRRAVCDRDAVENIVVRVLDRNDTVTILGEASRRAFVFAGAGNDWVSGTNASDVLYGADGDDQLYGYGGNDVVVGNAGSNGLRGGLGRDRLMANAPNSVDELDGGPDADQLYSRDNARDRGTGGAGDDAILRDDYDLVVD
jgi:Ca2+-binding RTX toxin-like protein